MDDFSLVEAFKMSSPIELIPGIGEKALEAFHRAGYRTVRDLHAFHLGDVAGDRRMMEAINDMKTEAGENALPARYYRSLGTRCANIVNRVRNATALPYAPDHLLCKITFDLLQDPVTAPSGYSYERTAIEEWIEADGRDPLTRTPLTIDKLYPNRALREAIAYYRTNHQTFIIPRFTSE